MSCCFSVVKGAFIETSITYYSMCYECVLLRYNKKIWAHYHINQSLFALFKHLNVTSRVSFKALQNVNGFLHERTEKKRPFIAEFIFF